MKIIAIVLAGLVLTTGFIGIGHAGEIVIGSSSGNSYVGCRPNPDCYPWWWNRSCYPNWNPCWDYWYPYPPCPYPWYSTSTTYETNSYYVDEIMY